MIYSFDRINDSKEPHKTIISKTIYDDFGTGTPLTNDEYVRILIPRYVESLDVLRSQKPNKLLRMLSGVQHPKVFDPEPFAEFISNDIAKYNKHGLIYKLVVDAFIEHGGDDCDEDIEWLISDAWDDQLSKCDIEKPLIDPVTYVAEVVMDEVFCDLKLDKIVDEFTIMYNYYHHLLEDAFTTIDDIIINVLSLTDEPQTSPPPPETEVIEHVIRTFRQMFFTTMYREYSNSNPSLSSKECLDGLYHEITSLALHYDIISDTIRPMPLIKPLAFASDRERPTLLIYLTDKPPKLLSPFLPLSYSDNNSLMNLTFGILTRYINDLLITLIDGEFTPTEIINYAYRTFFEADYYYTITTDSTDTLIKFNDSFTDEHLDGLPIHYSDDPYVMKLLR